MATFKIVVTTTVGDLPLGWPKGGHGRLTEVQFLILLYNYFGTLATGRLIEGGCLMERGLYYCVAMVI